MRTCIHCLLSKDDDSFKARTTGRIDGVCSACRNAEQRARYRASPEVAARAKAAAARYRREHREIIREQKREWSIAHRQEVRDAVCRSRERHPEHALARIAVREAIHRGVLVPRPCAICGAAAQAHHHRGYTKDRWLDVVWLCVPHHRALHRKYPEHIERPEPLPGRARVSDDALLSRIKERSSELGRRPKAGEMGSTTLYVQRFGSWSRALTLAGFPTAPGPGRRRRAEGEGVQPS